MTSTKGFVLVKTDVFIVGDAGKQGGFFSLSIKKKKSVNILARRDLICKDQILEKRTHTHKVTNN